MAIDAYQLELTPEVELVEIIDLCHLHGVRVLLDETKTAGRVGDGGLLGKPGVGTPDLVVFGKAIGNGAPLSLLLFDPELEATFVDAHVGGTYGKELSGVAAGLTTLRIMRRRKGWDLLSRVGTNIAQAINDGLSSSPLAGLCWVTPRFDGAMFDLLFRQDVVGQSDLRAGLQQSFLHEGIILLQGHPSFPTLAHEGIDPSILEEAGRAVSQSLAGAAILNATSANA
jgi:glutamate-1-semialdehyde 2,1-aminomutase